MKIKSYFCTAAVVLFPMSAANAASCLDDLTGKSGAVALLSCLKEMQAEIETLKTESGVPQVLSETQEAQIARQVASEHGNNAHMPSGAVVAFDNDLKSSPGCPIGWSFFEPAGGRVVVGAGDHDNFWFPDGAVKSIPLSIYPTYIQDERAGIQEKAQARATGGEERHTLSPSEMPTHSHSFTGTSLSRGKNVGGWATDVAVGSSKDSKAPGSEKLEIKGENGSTGKDESHNNMPPYIALYYCKKE